jgi:hypothetical protein
VCQKYNSLGTTAYKPEDGSCKTETRSVVVRDGHEIRVIKPGTAKKTALKTVFVFKCLSNDTRFIGNFRKLGGGTFLGVMIQGSFSRKTTTRTAQA